MSRLTEAQFGAIVKPKKDSESDIWIVPLYSPIRKCTYCGDPLLMARLTFFENPMEITRRGVKLNPRTADNVYQYITKNYNDDEHDWCYSTRLAEEEDRENDLWMAVAKNLEAHITDNQELDNCDQFST